MRPPGAEACGSTSKQGGDGVACWNAEAITAYAAAVDAREAALASANPDLVVTPGLVKCYGCEGSSSTWGSVARPS